MLKPKGGRGQRAPYDTTQMRVPVPIKAEVEAMIAAYRNSVLTGDDADASDSVALTELSSSLKLVDRFIEETQQAQSLHQRNNRNLVRFRDWLVEKLANSDMHI